MAKQNVNTPAIAKAASVVGNIFLFFLQGFFTFIVMWCIYMGFALRDSDWGIDGLFGFVIIQPVLGIIFSALTIFVCILLGLPIRLNSRVRRWWAKRFYFALAGVIAGLILLLLSLFFPTSVDWEGNGMTIQKQVPHTALAITGWFLTAFSCLHIFPPFVLSDSISRVSQSVTSVFKKRKQPPVF